MVNIYNYINYRSFIQDYYLDKKKKSPSFSYQIFADIADFNDKSSIYSIIKGKRNVSVNVVYKLSKAMNLKRAESEYFEVLVAFNQAKATHEKNHYFERLCKIRCRSKNSEALQLHTFRKDQFDFYSKWYNVMIRSIIEMHGFDGDYKRLASMTYPSITQKQARQSVKLLEKLELIRKNEKGEYKTTHKNVATGKELMPLAISNFHQECIKLASKALDEMPSEIRNFSGLTLGISDETYKTILSELREFQNRVTELASHDKKADRVYHFNFHLFPTSKNDKPNKKQL